MIKMSFEIFLYFIMIFYIFCKFLEKKKKKNVFELDICLAIIID